MNAIRNSRSEPRLRTGNPAFVKELNKSIILNFIRDCTPTSRAELARISGLNRATVSSLVAELIADDYVEEMGVGESPVGRKPIMLRFKPNAAVIMGIDLGVDYILILLTDLSAKILTRKKINFDHAEGKERIIERLLDSIGRIIEESPPTPKGLLGIGIGVPGLVRTGSGTLIFAPNLRWKNVPLKKIVQTHFNAQVYVDNEANMGALGEVWFGAAQRIQNMVYLSVGAGIGAGIVINGELYRGTTGYAGELGHFTIMPDGPRCSCGNRGCLEVLASETATLQRAMEAIRQGEKSILAENLQQDQGISISDLVRACKLGDKVAQRVLKETGKYLGTGIAGIVNAFNPSMVVIGNTMGQCGKWLFDEVKEEIRTRGLSELTKEVCVVPAALGEDACAMGGVSLVLSELLSLPKLSLSQ